MGVGPKQGAAGIGAALVAYFALLPFLWPQPTAIASIPTAISLNQDTEIEITVHAWHSNVDVSQVRFYADFSTSTAKGPNGLFDPVVLLDAPPREFRGFLAASLLTRPWSKRLKVTLPLGEFAQQGLVGPGTLEGKLDVTIHFAAKNRRGTSSRQVTEAISFRIAVSE